MTEIFMQYLTEIISALLSAFAVWLGLALKNLAQKHVNTQTKKDVARTVVQAVEQIYKDLHGEEKLNKALEAASEILTAQGIHVTGLELRTLIEDAVGEFNGVFWKENVPTVVEGIKAE